MYHQVHFLSFFGIIFLVLECSSGAPISSAMYPMDYAINVIPTSSQMPLSLRPNRIFYDAIGNWINQQEWLPYEVNIPDTINNIANNVQTWTSGIIQRIPFLNRNPGYVNSANNEDEFIHHYVIIPPYHHYLNHHLHPWHLHQYFRDAGDIKMPIEMMNIKADTGITIKSNEDVDGALRQVENWKDSQDKTSQKSDKYQNTYFVTLDLGNGLFEEPVFDGGVPVYP